MTREQALAALLEIDDKLGTYYDVVTDSLERELNKSVVKSLARLVTSLEKDLVLTRAGKVARVPKNLRRLTRLDREFEELLDDTGYNRAALAFVKQFPGQLPLLWDSLDILSAQLKRPLVRRQMVTTPTWNELRTHMDLTRQSIVDISAKVAMQARTRAMTAVGAADRDAMTEVLSSTFGVTTGQARTLGATGLAQFYRIAHERTVERVDPKSKLRYTYAGPADKLNRPWCRRMLRMAASGRTWTKVEIEAMDNGQLANPFLTCGGWNCRHQWRLAL